MRPSKNWAILRMLSLVRVGPKKFYSIQGMPYVSSMWRQM